MSLRVAMISEHASPLAALGGQDCGGQNVYVAQLAQHLVSMGAAVDVFTRKDRPGLPPVTTFGNGVRVIHVPAGPPTTMCKEELWPHMEAFARFFTHFCEKQAEAYDIVHAHFWMSAWVALRARQALGLPFVVTFHALGKVRRLHQGAQDRFPDERMTIEHLVLRHADRIIAECPQDRDDLVTLYSADRARIEIIPCGFDASLFWPIPKAAARRVLGLGETEPVLLQLGRLVPRKGVDNVIRSVGRLRARHGISARLLIVGGENQTPDGRQNPEVGRLEALARDVGVCDQVSLVGRRDGAILRYYYSAADVFVSTPWYEPFGITPLEAMACGTPVIGARVGGIQYTVRELQTGWLVPPKDPDALADTLAVCFAQPELRARMGTQAVRHVHETFAWADVSRTVHALYRKVARPARIPEVLEHRVLLETLTSRAGEETESAATTLMTRAGH